MLASPTTTNIKLQNEKPKKLFSHITARGTTTSIAIREMSQSSNRPSHKVCSRKEIPLRRGVSLRNQEQGILMRRRTGMAVSHSREHSLTTLLIQMPLLIPRSFLLHQELSRAQVTVRSSSKISITLQSRRLDNTQINLPIHNRQGRSNSIHRNC